MKCPKCDTPLTLVEASVPVPVKFPTELASPTQQEPVQSGMVPSDAISTPQMAPRPVQSDSGGIGRPRWSPNEWESKVRVRVTDEQGEKMASSFIKKGARDDFKMLVVCKHRGCPVWDNAEENRKKRKRGERHGPDYPCKGYVVYDPPPRGEQKPVMRVIREPCTETDHNGKHWPVGWWWVEDQGACEWYDPDTGGEPYSSKGVLPEDVEKAHYKEMAGAAERDVIRGVADEVSGDTPTQAQLDAQNKLVRDMVDEEIPF